MSNKKDSLGDRMKENYENRAKTFLCRRTPVIIRLDGRCFHTFTKGFKRPYDEIFHNAMNDTVKYLCENIQGCKIGYTQSDEITLLLTDYENLDTAAWFDYAVEKMCSISASMATLAFNKALREHFEKKVVQMLYDYDSYDWPREEQEYFEVIENALEKGAMFDSRVFNIPKEEVANCFIWRQQDATRNAIQMLGQTYFSHKELDKKTCNMIQDMLMTQKGINFNDMPIEFKRGVCCIKESYIDATPESTDSKNVRTKWVIDKEIPIFTQDREYIERYVLI